MDDFDRTQFRRRSSSEQSLPEVTKERRRQSAKATDQFKARIPRELRRCEVCGWQPPAPPLKLNRTLFLLHAHHIVPVSRQGTDEPENLILLCANCHDIADYLSGRSIGTEYIKTRDVLLENLALLRTDPDAWEQRQQEWAWDAQKRCTNLLGNLLHP